MEKSAVVFGGNGFIGQHLLHFLYKRGYSQIISADIREPGVYLDGIHYVTCDVREPLTGLINGPIDEVYNLAAIHTTPGHPEHEYYETNVLGALNITKFCETKAVRTLCFTSSISVYGPSERPMTEECELSPVSAYGKSKLIAENIHESWAKAKEDRKLAIGRLAVIFGPGENGNFTRLARMLSKRLFLYPGRRDTVKGCAYVGEVLRSFEFALNMPEAVYIFNLAYPKPYTIEDICQTFHEIAGFPLPWGKIPTSLMMCAALPFEVINSIGLRNSVCRARVKKLLHSTFVMPARLLADGYQFETNLAEGLRLWRDLSFNGHFV